MADMPTPSLGRIVIVAVDPRANNGTDEAPGIISRVWSDNTVNVRVLFDGDEIAWQTSVTLFESRDALLANYQQLLDDGVITEETVPFGAYWPQRV
ncbi:hypothetical protein [Streptomyces sp. NPDC057257]|uniref:hypothetical protein n=1 Tax=Streptomyces sp. NPDC057257 TaxID=3346071 RepID=UPI00363A3DB3